MHNVSKGIAKCVPKAKCVMQAAQAGGIELIDRNVHYLGAPAAQALCSMEICVHYP